MFLGAVVGLMPSDIIRVLLGHDGKFRKVLDLFPWLFGLGLWIKRF
jgi:hypothetical protein